EDVHPVVGMDRLTRGSLRAGQRVGVQPAHSRPGRYRQTGRAWRETMTRSRAAGWCVVAVLGCVMASRSLAAHHGTLVSYDRDKAWTAKAVVTEFRYVNPHAQLY